MSLTPRSPRYASFESRPRCKLSRLTCTRHARSRRVYYCAHSISLAHAPPFARSRASRSPRAPRTPKQIAPSTHKARVLSQRFERGLDVQFDLRRRRALLIADAAPPLNPTACPTPTAHVHLSRSLSKLVNFHTVDRLDAGRPGQERRRKTDGCDAATACRRTGRCRSCRRRSPAADCKPRRSQRYTRPSAPC